MIDEWMMLCSFPWITLDPQLLPGLLQKMREGTDCCGPVDMWDHYTAKKNKLAWTFFLLISSSLLHSNNFHHGLHGVLDHWKQERPCVTARTARVFFNGPVVLPPSLLFEFCLIRILWRVHLLKCSGCHEIEGKELRRRRSIWEARQIRNGDWSFAPFSP